MRRIAVINQKGGVGKTTSCVNLGAALAERGQRVLLIDLDPQAHLTAHLGLDGDAGPGTYELLTESPLTDGMLVTAENGITVIRSRMDLAAAESELISVVGREVILRDRLAGISDRYDWLLIDCPPSFSVLTLNALVTVEEVIVPLQAHFLGLQGVGRLLQTVTLVSQRINPNLKVAGFVLCMHEAGTRLATEVVDDLTNFLAEARTQAVAWRDARVFATRIRRNIKLAECPSYGQSIFKYAPKSHGAEDYRALTDELTGKAIAVEKTPSQAQEVQPPANGSPAANATVEIGASEAAPANGAILQSARAEVITTASTPMPSAPSEAQSGAPAVQVGG